MRKFDKVWPNRFHLPWPQHFRRIGAGLPLCGDETVAKSKGLAGWARGRKTYLEDSRREEILKEIFEKKSYKTILWRTLKTVFDDSL